MPLRRHQFVRVCADALEAQSGRRDEPLLRYWLARGWPLIVRRSLAEETGVPLGLALPPSSGKRRLSLTVQREHIAAVAEPPTIAEVLDAAPQPWRPVLHELQALATAHEVCCRVFGGLAWQLLTGLQYLSASSDLDLLLDLPSGAGRLASLLTGLAEIDSRAPMRIDGELVRSDRAGVNWRELHAAPREVVVKTATEPLLMSVERFTGVSQ